MVLRFDEINKINLPQSTRKKQSLPYEQFFGEMNLDKEEKEKRISFANKLDDVFFFVFALIYADYKLNGTIDSIRYRNMVYDRYLEVLEDFTDREIRDPYLRNRIMETSEQIIDTTVRNITDDYYLSEDRVTLISENESNICSNYDYHLQAIRDGKKRKTWITMHDSKVRDTHKDVDNQTIGIHETFNVGGSEMLFPTDTSYGANAEEIVNCRCTVRYS